MVAWLSVAVSPGANGAVGCPLLFQGEKTGEAACDEVPFAEMQRWQRIKCWETAWIQLSAIPLVKQIASFARVYVTIFQMYLQQSHRWVVHSRAGSRLMSQQSGHRAMRCLNQALLCIVAFPWAVSGGWITGSLVGSIPLYVGMSCDDMIWGMIHFVNFFLFEIITLGKLKNSPFVFVCGCVSVFPLDNGDVPLPRE